MEHEANASHMIHLNGSAKRLDQAMNMSTEMTLEVALRGHYVSADLI